MTDQQRIAELEETVRRLRAERDEMILYRATASTVFDELVAERDELRAVLARVTAERDELLRRMLGPDDMP